MTKVFSSSDIWNEMKDREYIHICDHEIMEFVGRPRCLDCGIEFDDYGNPILERE
jgi:hypothetical protein